MSWWQVLLVAVTSIWIGVSWVEEAVDKIVARRLAAHLIALESMLMARGAFPPDPPWPDEPEDDDL